MRICRLSFLQRKKLFAFESRQNLGSQGRTIAPLRIPSRRWHVADLKFTKGGTRWGHCNALTYPAWSQIFPDHLRLSKPELNSSRVLQHVQGCSQSCQLRLPTAYAFAHVHDASCLLRLTSSSHSHIGLTCTATLSPVLSLSCCLLSTMYPHAPLVGSCVCDLYISYLSDGLLPGGLELI